MYRERLRKMRCVTKTLEYTDKNSLYTLFDTQVLPKVELDVRRWLIDRMFGRWSNQTQTVRGAIREAGR